MSDGREISVGLPLAGTIAAAARVGATVDKYRIVRVLGQGGMGAVFEARHLRLDRRFAIKFLLPRHAENPEILRRFENEAKAAGGLEHPNLAAVVDFGRADDGSPYIVMEFLEGRDGARLLRAEGALPVRRAANIIAQACRGVAKAHGAGIVHRDLKPENLFVIDAGDGTDLVKVLDFGIAKLRTIEAGPATGTGEMFGTAHYMSPEQARGTGDVDQRTDVWSLGVVLYELLSGCKPFEGRTFLDLVYQIQTFESRPLSAINPDLPEALIRVVQRAMAKDLSRRIPSALALADELLPFLAGTRDASASAATRLGPETRRSDAGGGGDNDRSADRSPSRATAPQPSPRPAGRRARWLVATGLLLVVAGIGFVAYRRSLVGAGDSPESAVVAPASSTSPAIPSAPPAVSRPPVRVPAAASVPAPSVDQPVFDPPPLGDSRQVGGVPAQGSRTVRIPSEGAKRRPKERGAPPALVPATPPEPVVVPAPPPNPARAAERPASGRPIYIDKDDPFGP